MHRTNCMPQLQYAPAGRMPARPIGATARAVRGSLGALLLGLLLSIGLPGTVSAQPSGAIIMPLNGSATREHASKKKIKKIDVDPANVARVRLLQPNYTSVVIVAEGVGRATVRLTD